MKDKRDSMELEIALTALMMILASLFALVFIGCTTASVRNITKDGREFEVSITSCLWDRQLKGFKFDYEKGTLEVQTYRSTPDKETIGKALDTARSALDLASKLAL